MAALLTTQHASRGSREGRVPPEIGQYQPGDEETTSKVSLQGNRERICSSEVLENSDGKL